MNHCIQEGGSCTIDFGAGSDGDRIGSNEATPSGNTGGGLGNWHDMGHCCANENYGSGMPCVGDSFRTTSEAQSGWSPCYGGSGFFGSDTFGPAKPTCDNTTCGDSNFAEPNGLAYDYAIWLR